MLRSHRTTILGTLLCVLAGIGIALIWHGAPAALKCRGGFSSLLYCCPLCCLTWWGAFCTRG